MIGWIVYASVTGAAVGGALSIIWMLRTERDTRHG